MLVRSQELTKKKNQLYFSKAFFFFLVVVSSYSLSQSTDALRTWLSIAVRNLKEYVRYERSFSLGILYCRVVWSRLCLHFEVSVSMGDLLRANPHAWQWSTWFPSCSSVKCRVLGRQWDSLMCSFFPLAERSSKPGCDCTLLNSIAVKQYFNIFQLISSY